MLFLNFAHFSKNWFLVFQIDTSHMTASHTSHGDLTIRHHFQEVVLLLKISPPPSFSHNYITEKFYAQRVKQLMQ